MRYPIRPSARGTDRRNNRSLADLLAAGAHHTDPDPTPPHGIPRPDLTGVEVKDDPYPGREELDEWAPEDIEEQRRLREERLKDHGVI